MTSADSRPRPVSRRRGAFTALALATALLALVGGVGCGIGDSVANECITKQRVYDRAQKRTTSLIVAGVPTDAAVHRAARKRLAEARSEYGACTARRASRGI